MRLLWLSLMLLSAVVGAEDMSPADRLSEQLGSVTSFSAVFSQVSIDSRGRVLSSGTGRIEVRRPNKLRWHVDPPREQLLISDGELMWFYDPDLEQVTVRKIEATIDRIPALILAGDDGSIHKEFEVALNESGGVQNYELRPLRESAEFRQVNLRLISGQVQKLSVIDALNQRLDIEFDSVVINQEPESDAFTFKVPEGVDVLEDY